MRTRNLRPRLQIPPPAPPPPCPPPRAYLHRLYVHTAVMGLKWKIWKKNISFLKRLVRPASPDFWLALSCVIISLLLFIVNMFATKLLLSSHVCLNPSYRCRWEWVGKARINVKDFSFHDFGDYSNHSQNWKVTKSVDDPPVWEARFRQLFFWRYPQVPISSFFVICCFLLLIMLIYIYTSIGKLQNHQQPWS